MDICLIPNFLPPLFFFSFFQIWFLLLIQVEMDCPNDWNPTSASALPGQEYPMKLMCLVFTSYIYKPWDVLSTRVTTITRDNSNKLEMTLAHRFIPHN
jgi:hypothetical protein